MSSNMGRLDLNYVPSPDFTIFLKRGEGCFSPGAEIQNDWEKLQVCSALFRQENGSINDQFNRYLTRSVIKDLTGQVTDSEMQVVPKSILVRVENSWRSLIEGTKDLIQNQNSTLNSIFNLNVLGAGLIAGSAIGLCYTQPEYKKTRIGLKALFIAGLTSIVFAAFKANSSINSLQRL